MSSASLHCAKNDMQPNGDFFGWCHAAMLHLLRKSSGTVTVIEDLNVTGMLENHHLAQAIGDVGCGEFRRQLSDKATCYGCRVVFASWWEPSSKTCSGCG